MGLHLLDWPTPAEADGELPTEKLARVIAYRTVRIEPRDDRHGFNWGLLAGLLFGVVVWAAVIYSAVMA